MESDSGNSKMRIHHIADEIYLIGDILDLDSYPDLWDVLMAESNIEGKRKAGRRMCRMTDPEMKYTLYGKPYAKKNYTPTVKRIQHDLEQKLGIVDNYFNTCTMNFYPSGRSGFRPHTDYMPDLAKPMLVTMLTLGESNRPMHLIRRKNLTSRFKEEEHMIKLPHNSLLLMGPRMQNYWLHGVPNVKGCKEPRLSLSYRRQRLTKNENLGWAKPNNFFNTLNIK